VENLRLWFEPPGCTNDTPTEALHVLPFNGGYRAPSAGMRPFMMPMSPSFDIFSGRFGEKGVLWLGAVARLEDARARMLNLATKQPGAYFVFNSDSHLIVAAVDTSPPMHASEPVKAKDAA
jgi:hypothetical protein